MKVPWDYALNVTNVKSITFRTLRGKGWLGGLLR
jgi:hypothetical protein